MANPRLIITLSPYLKRELERLAELHGSSQAEVLKTGLIRLLEAEKRGTP
jgi:hypothetical protein